MDLENKINTDIRQAMLAKDSRRLEALRAVKAALLLAKTSKETHGGEVAEEAGLKILQKLIKQRQESAEMYRNGGRSDLAEEETFQASVIEAYLPAQMNEGEIRAALESIISQTGATGIKDLGKVMGMASKQFAGKADNKIVAALVRELLGG
jgi:hypothetical protein